MSKWTEMSRKALPAVIVLGVLGLKIGPANIARRFDNFWNADKIAAKKTAADSESAREIGESMVRRFEKPAFSPVK